MSPALPAPWSCLRLGLACLTALVLQAQTAPAPTPSGPQRRFALIIGNNQGGDGTRPLLYAADDARRMHEVLLRLGGTAPDDAMLLVNDSSDDVLTALAEVERRIRDARQRGERTTLFFYYSGHAKDGALRLGTTKLPMESVKARLAQGPADMRVAVFDACRSGSLTRTKGVRKAPAFEVETDATRAAKGLVILTSSASDEDSQESDAIGASYFSYHLVSGLLGSADQSGDGRVSLAEAYAWAYERTVAATADSAAGPQHPTFSFDLAGNGDLVLTDVVQRREGLRIPLEAPEGTYFLIDRRGVVVAEITKSGAERTIALAPGTYTVKRRLPDRLRVGEVKILDGQLATLDEAQLKNAKFSDDPVKGTGLTTVYSRHWSISATGQYQAIFDAPTTQGGVFPSAPLVGGEATVHNFFGRGFAWSFDGQYGWSTGAVASPRLGTPATYRYSLITVGTSLLYEWNQEGSWVPFAGVRLNLSLMNREFDDTLFPRQGFTTMSPGAVLGLKYRIGRSFGLVARGRVHYLLYNVDETKNLGFAEVGLLVSYEFRD